MAEALAKSVHRRRVLLVARKAVEGLGKDDREPLIERAVI